MPSPSISTWAGVSSLSTPSPTSSSARKYSVEFYVRRPKAPELNQYLDYETGATSVRNRSAVCLWCVNNWLTSSQNDTGSSRNFFHHDHSRADGVQQEWDQRHIFSGRQRWERLARTGWSRLSGQSLKLRSTK